jgi:membrane-associated phospholipid phosphatase
MPRRARVALIGAGVGVVMLAITWYLAHYVGIFKREDAAILDGFVELHRPRLDRITSFFASLCDPDRYVILAAIPVIVALVRRRVRVAAMIALILLGANETTQLLKPLLAAPRDPVAWYPLSWASWPSGHATAAMSLALCSVIAAPPRWRSAVAAVMSAFAIIVAYSFLELGWHYPSDVFGGFLVAATWTLAGIAGLSIYDARRVGGRPEEARARRAAGAGSSVIETLKPVAVMLAVAALLAVLIVLIRPHEVIAYARGHQAFVIGATSIGVLGLMLGSGLSLMLRRS